MQQFSPGEICYHKLKASKEILKIESPPLYQQVSYHPENGRDIPGIHQEESQLPIANQYHSLCFKMKHGCFQLKPERERKKVGVSILTPWKLRPQHEEEVEGMFLVLLKRNIPNVPIKPNKGGIMKVLFIHSSAKQIVGSEMTMLRLLDQLPINIQRIVVLPEKGPLYDRLKEKGIEVHLLPLAHFHRKQIFPFVKGAWSLFRALRKLSPDLIHLTSASPMQYSWLVSRMLRIPLICQIQCPYDSDDRRRYFPHKADKIILISNALKNDYSNAKQDRVQVIYNGIPIPKITRYEAKKELFREFRLGWNSRVVGITGQIIHRKGIDLFLKAAREVLIKFPDTYFMIVGDDQNAYAEQLKLELLKERISSRVIWTGYRKNIQQLMAGMNILTVPSRKEGFGLVAAEALATGTPVIASNTGGLKEIITPRVTGYLIPVDDAESLAQKIMFLLSSPRLCEWMGNQGKLAIKRKFSMENQIHQLEAVYHSLLSKNANPITINKGII